MSLLVNEIFYSIQGEGTRAGRPCVFVRLTGCPLRCTYCDTAYAFAGGDRMTVENVLEAVSKRLGSPRSGPEAPFVEVTGGEPLAQPEAVALLHRLVEAGYETALETSGSEDISRVPPKVVKIVDRKTPGSGEAHRWREDTLNHLIPGQDELKLVLTSPEDYAWGVAWVEERGLWDRFTVLFSPVTPGLDPRWLAERMLADRLAARFQLQLHKVVWPPSMRGV